MKINHKDRVLECSQELVDWRSAFGDDRQDVSYMMNLIGGLGWNASFKFRDNDELGSFYLDDTLGFETRREMKINLMQAVVNGYEFKLEEEKYYWRKKREHLASFEDDLYLKIIEPFVANTKHVAPSERYSESEVISHLGVTDFELFEKVED